MLVLTQVYGILLCTHLHGILWHIPYTSFTVNILYIWQHSYIPSYDRIPSTNFIFLLSIIQILTTMTEHTEIITLVPDWGAKNLRWAPWDLLWWCKGGHTKAVTAPPRPRQMHPLVALPLLLFTTVIFVDLNRSFPLWNCILLPLFLTSYFLKSSC